MTLGMSAVVLCFATAARAVHGTHPSARMGAWRAASWIRSPVSTQVAASRLRGGVGGARMSTAAPSTRQLMETALLVPSADVAVKASGAKVSEWNGDLLLALVPQAEKDDAPHVELSGELAALDTRLEGILSAAIADASFKGKPGDSRTLTLAPKYGVKKVALVGVGKPPAPDASAQATLAAAAKWGSQLATVAKAEKAASAAVALPAGVDAAGVQAGVEAALTGLAADERFKDRHAEALKTAAERELKLKQIELLGAPSDAAAAIDRAVGISGGVLLTKGLVASPANYLTPTALAKTAEVIASDFGLKLTVLEQDECERRGMGAYLGVAQGAVEPPKFIHLTYSPPDGQVKSRVALIGKGLTFDSGGYNLKAGAGSLIEKMKFDMGGAGAVLGAARAVGALKPAGVEVHFIVAACENMVSERAMRPGDILTASNDKTIEVLNTDAEGRLTLADALVYAEALGAEGGKLDAIVDVATLTGACIIALGDRYAGLWASTDGLATQLQGAAERSGELVWRMPLASEYSDELKSPIADLKNVGGRAGSSISAALFLKEFVKEAPWAHIDIAGPVWSDKTGGATGYGVRMLYRFVEEAGASK